MMNMVVKTLLILGLISLQLNATETNTLESARIRWASAELAEATQTLASTTNEANRLLCERRIDLAKKALENYKLQAELDQREMVLSQARQRSTDFRLRKAVSAIETDEETPKRAAAAHNAEIRKVKERRAEEEARRDRERATPEPSIAELARYEARLVNTDAEILANMLERDSEELKLRLAREAKRVDAIFSSPDQEVRMTLGILLDARRAIKRNTERLEECNTIHAELEALSADTHTAIEIVQQRVSQLKQEISILKHRSRVEQESDSSGDGESQRMRNVWKKLIRSGTQAEKQLKQMIGDVEAEIDPLQKKIEHLDRQGMGVRSSLSLSELARELFQAEGASLAHKFAQMKRRYLKRILLPIAAILIVTTIYLLLSRFLFPSILKQDNLFVARRLGSYGAILVIFMVLVTFFLEDLKAIATIMGIVGAAVVIALQDMCSAFAGWFVIIASRKLRVGDRVEINGHRGEIIDIQMLRTTLVELNNWLEVDEATGRTIIIPNSFIFKSEVFNYSHIHPHIWGKVDITVTFETPPEKAYELFFRVLEEETRSAYAAAARGGAMMAKLYGVSRGIYEPHIHTIVADSGVCYSLFYVAHYRRFTTMRDAIMTKVIEAVNQTPGVEFAYPTERHVPTPPTAVQPVASAPVAHPAEAQE
jgi:small-conductance mechanosensitive channel